MKWVLRLIDHNYMLVGVTYGVTWLILTKSLQISFHLAVGLSGRAGAKLLLTLFRQKHLQITIAFCKHFYIMVCSFVCVRVQGTVGSADLSACGLHPASMKQLQQPSGLGKTALTHISMNNYSYTWRSWTQSLPAPLPPVPFNSTFSA